MALARRIYATVTWVLIGAVILLAMLVVGVRIVGLTPYAVISGSMEPAYPVGSLLYIQKTDATALQAGDPVTYRMSGGQIVTHRVIEVVEDPVMGRCYRTQGDANDTADGPLLSPSSVIGKPVACIPMLGYVSFYIQNPPGTYVAMAAVFALLGLTMLTDLIFPKEEKKEDTPPPTEETPTDAVDNPC